MSRPKVTTQIAAFALVLMTANAHALDPQGNQAGQLAGAYVNQKYGSQSSINQNVTMPLTDQNTPLTSLDGSQMGSGVAFCGQGNIQNQQTVLQVTLDGVNNVLTVSSDTSGTGVLSSTNTASITQICTNGFLYNTSSYYTYTVSTAGVVGVVSSGPLSGCVSPASTPPSYAGGRIAQLYATATGRTIMGEKANGSTITYYSGQVKDCSNNQQNLSETQYYNNPYAMESDASTSMATCTNPQDPSCSAYQGITNADNNYQGSGPSTVTCTLTRTIIDSKAPQNGNICQANITYYANGYSSTNKYCLSGTRWDYSSQIDLKCNPWGNGLTAEGWASWEGAPCGAGDGTANFPPTNQMVQAVAYSTTTDSVVGNFSVNYRMDGPDTAYNDLSVNTTCYSTANPLAVHLATNCAGDQSSCDYNFTVANAPACGTFTVHVTPPPGQTISDGCQLYESNYSCKLQQETWFDVNGNGVQIMANSTATNNPVTNTCNTYANAGVVCEPWWTDGRTYSCETTTMPPPDITREQTVINSTSMTGTTINYSSPECVTGTNCTVSVWDQQAEDPTTTCETSCLIKRPAGASQQGNSSYNYYVLVCTPQTSGTTTTYTCPSQSGDTLLQDCGCIDTSGLAIGTIGAFYEATKDRTCLP